MNATPRFADTAGTQLAKALATPGETIIVITMDAAGGLFASVCSDRARDLVDAARCLLDQAADRLEEAGAGDADEDLHYAVMEALGALPDPLADEDDDA